MVEQEKKRKLKRRKTNGLKIICNYNFGDSGLHVTKNIFIWKFDIRL